MNKTSVVLEKKVIDSKRVESIVQLGNNIIRVKSTFAGPKNYSDILGRIIENKIKQTKFN